MILELVAQVAIHAQVVEEVVALEHAVLFDHPEVFRAYERLEDGGGNVRVVVAAQGVTDIVQQRADDIFLIPTVTVGARRGLDRMFQAIDRKSAVVTVQQAQVGEDAVGQILGERTEVLGDDAPVFCGSFLHGTERGVLLTHDGSPLVICFGSGCRHHRGDSCR